MVVRSFCLAIAAVVAVAVAASTTSSGSTSLTRRTFAVTLRGTIEQVADYKQQMPRDECPYVYSGRWNNKLEFRSQRPTRLVVTRVAGRLRFSPAGLSALGGTQTTRGAGVAEAPGCQTVVVDCFIRADSFHGGRTALASPRRGILALGPLRHRQLREPCGNPERLGGKTAGADLARGRIGPNLLGTPRRRVVVTGSYQATRALGPPKVDSGTLETKVSWSLTFTPVRR